MARVKRGVAAKKRKKNVLKQAKGFRWGRSTKYRLAKDALRHAWEYAFRDRRAKKRSFRTLWETSISGGVREAGLRYSEFIPLMKKANITLDRKILAQLRQQHPELFEAVMNMVREKRG